MIIKKWLTYWHIKVIGDMIDIQVSFRDKIVQRSFAIADAERRERIKMHRIINAYCVYALLTVYVISIDVVVICIRYRVQWHPISYLPLTATSLPSFRFDSSESCDSLGRGFPSSEKKNLSVSTALIAVVASQKTSRSKMRGRKRRKRTSTANIYFSTLAIHAVSTNLSDNTI